MKFALLFPGQGAQYVGMGAALFDAYPDRLIRQADAVLGWSLRDMCLDGPEETLTRTEHAQPALFALAYVQWEALASRLPRAPDAAAGHSLGEYTALTAAGSIGFEEGLGLVAKRGTAMAAAADLEPSAMAALLGADQDAVESIADQRRSDGGKLWVANINAPGQVVVAGGVPDVEWVVENSRDLGVRRAVRLAVAGGFHSPYMRPAAEQLAVAIDAVNFATPAFAVYGNVTAQPLGGDVGALLVQQLTSPVRFAESLTNMVADGIEAFVHVGPGDVTAGMAKRATPDAEIVVVNDDMTMMAALSKLSI